QVRVGHDPVVRAEVVLERAGDLQVDVHARAAGGDRADEVGAVTEVLHTLAVELEWHVADAVDRDLLGVGGHLPGANHAFVDEGRLGGGRTAGDWRIVAAAA